MTQSDSKSAQVALRNLRSSATAHIVVSSVLISLGSIAALVGSFWLTLPFWMNVFSGLTALAYAAIMTAVGIRAWQTRNVLYDVVDGSRQILGVLWAIFWPASAILAWLFLFGTVVLFGTVALLGFLPPALLLCLLGACSTNKRAAIGCAASFGWTLDDLPSRRLKRTLPLVLIVLQWIAIFTSWPAFATILTTFESVGFHTSWH